MAAVGSSISTILGFDRRVRAIATAWRWPPDISRTRWRGRRFGLEFGEQFAGALVHRVVVEPPDRPDPLDLAAQEHVGGGRKIVAQREVLVDDLDALLARFDGLVEMDRLAVERISPDVGGKFPAITLTSVDLPAPLSPIKPRTSPGSTDNRRRSAP